MHPTPSPIPSRCGARRPALPRLRFAALLLAALAGLAGAGAAEASGLHVFVRKVETDEFPRVRAIFDLRSPEKLPFRKLSAANVRLVEEEVEIRDFEVKPYRSGVSIGLVVDDSGSEDPTLGYLKEAASYLADQLAPYDEMAVVGFGRVIRPLQQLTTDKRLMKDAIASLKAYGGSALYDGIAAAMQESSRGVGRQVVVVVSDGHEQDFPYRTRRLSGRSLERVVRAARAHGINIYTIGVGARADTEVLSLLAEETGGRYLAAPRAASLRALFADLAAGFESSFQAIYQSPCIKEDRLLRGGMVKLDFMGRTGAGPFRYHVRARTPVSSLTLSRAESWMDGYARLRLYTRAGRDTFVELEFALRDAKGTAVREGRTTRDGYGAPLGGGMPELLELPAGRYTLELKEPGTDLVFRHPGLILERGRSTDLNFSFSRLVFRRNGQLWYDTEHDLAETSDLIDLTVQELTSGKVLRSGPMSIFKGRRDASLLLEVGAYRIKMDNLWAASGSKPSAGKTRKGSPPPPPPGIEAQVLRNALTAEVAAKGGDVLFFDVKYDDLLAEQDPRLVPDDLPEPPREGQKPAANRRLASIGHCPVDSRAANLRDALSGLLGEEEKQAPAKVSAADLSELRSRIRKLSGPARWSRGQASSPARRSAPPVSAPSVPDVPPVPEPAAPPKRPAAPKARPAKAQAPLPASGTAAAPSRSTAEDTVRLTASQAATEHEEPTFARRPGAARWTPVRRTAAHAAPDAAAAPTMEAPASSRTAATRPVRRPAAASPRPVPPAVTDAIFDEQASAPVAPAGLTRLPSGQQQAAPAAPAVGPAPAAFPEIAAALQAPAASPPAASQESSPALAPHPLTLSDLEAGKGGPNAGRVDSDGDVYVTPRRAAKEAAATAKAALPARTAAPAAGTGKWLVAQPLSTTAARGRLEPLQAAVQVGKKAPDLPRARAVDRRDESTGNASPSSSLKPQASSLSAGRARAVETSRQDTLRQLESLRSGGRTPSRARASSCGPASTRAGEETEP
jgi:Meckel syndrome type 1 protein